MTTNPIERSYRNTGTNNALSQKYRGLKNITKKRLWHSSFGLKRYLKLGHTRIYFCRCCSYCFYEDLENTTTTKILIPDTTGVQWIIAVVTVSRCKVKMRINTELSQHLDLLMSIPMRNTAVLKGVYLHSPPWNMNNQLLSAQKFPLSTSIFIMPILKTT